MSSSPYEVLSPTQGRAVWVLAARGRTLVPGEHTGGAYAVVETTAGPGGGPPPHVHAREDELFYVVEGELGLVYAHRQFWAKAGDAVFLPRGMPHTFAPVGDGLAKFVVLTAPAGFERFSAEVGTETSAAGPFDPPPVTPEAIGRLVAIAAKYGIELLPNHPLGEHAELPRHREQHWVLGEHVRVLLTAEQTGDQFTVAEVTSRPGGGVPPHRHAVEDELFYVLAGTPTFLLEDDAVEAGPGTFVRVPKGVWHGFVNTGNVPSKVLDVHTPGGFESFFRDLGTPCEDPDDGPPAVLTDLPSVLAKFAKHGVEVRPQE